MHVVISRKGTLVGWQRRVHSKHTSLARCEACTCMRKPERSPHQWEIAYIHLQKARDTGREGGWPAGVDELDVGPA